MNEHDTICPVCMEEVYIDQPAKICTSYHPVHIKCFQGWVKVKRTCPKCVAEYSEKDSLVADYKGLVRFLKVANVRFKNCPIIGCGKMEDSTHCKDYCHFMFEKLRDEAESCTSYSTRFLEYTDLISYLKAYGVQYGVTEWSEEYTVRLRSTWERWVKCHFHEYCKGLLSTCTDKCFITACKIDELIQTHIGRIANDEMVLSVVCHEFFTPEYSFTKEDLLHRFPNIMKWIRKNRRRALKK